MDLLGINRISFVQPIKDKSYPALKILYFITIDPYQHVTEQAIVQKVFNFTVTCLTLLNKIGCNLLVKKLIG